MKILYTTLLLLLFLTGSSFRILAQDNYEIQVYASELTEKHHSVFELHSNFTMNGSTEMQANVYPSNHAFHETLEITHGFSKWLEVGSYLFTSIGSGNRTALTGVHIRPRFSVPEEYHLPFGISLGAEVGYQNPAFFGSTWAAEIRPIFDKKSGKFYFGINLAMGIVLDKNQDHHPELSPCLKTSYEVSGKVSLGLEYYSALGAINDFETLQQQRHQLFAAVDWDFNPDWEFNAGVGYGLTQGTDQWVAKVILGYRLPF
ncbi:MAG: transporter [Prolixibacteraceae bacterium]